MAKFRPLLSAGTCYIKISDIRLGDVGKFIKKKKKKKKYDNKIRTFIRRNYSNLGGVNSKGISKVQFHSGSY